MDHSYVIGLVWSWIAQHPDYYCSWVGPYTQLRWCPDERRMVGTVVGGHYRRLATMSQLMPALACTCNFERLVQPITRPPRKTPRDTSIRPYPQRYRAYIWA